MGNVNKLNRLNIKSNGEYLHRTKGIGVNNVFCQQLNKDNRNPVTVFLYFSTIKSMIEVHISALIDMN